MNTSPPPIPSLSPVNIDPAAVLETLPAQVTALQFALDKVVVGQTSTVNTILYALLSRFEGYFPGYSSLPARNPGCLTWVVLKAHTNNTAGTVTLRSSDPPEPRAMSSLCWWQTSTNSSS